jgi:hypothetical protein
MVRANHVIYPFFAMTQGFAPTPSPAQQSVPATASAIDAEAVQSKWLSYFETLDDPRGAKVNAIPS